MRVESFHWRLRDECLTVSWFQNLFDAKKKIADWKIEENEEGPHSSLGCQTPKEFASRSPIPAQTGEGVQQRCRILR
jgi:putative transposase